MKKNKILRAIGYFIGFCLIIALAGFSVWLAVKSIQAVISLF